MAEGHQCAKRVFSGERWDAGGHQCGTPATLEHEGKWYCKRHYPPNVKEHAEKSEAEWKAKWEREDREREAKRAAAAEAARKVAAFDRLVAWLNADPASRFRAEMYREMHDILGSGCVPDYYEQQAAGFVQIAEGLLAEVRAVLEGK